MENSRELAIYILSRLEASHAYLGILLDAELRKSSLNPKDKSLVTELVYGVTRWRKTLDWYLDQVCKKPIDTAHPILRQILRSGAYQLLMLDRIPASAAINESVKLAGQYSQETGLPAKTAKGFVNGVLRQLDRMRQSLKSPDTLTDPVRRIAVAYSFPEWMIARWLTRLGEQATIETCRILNQPSRLTFRVNTLKTTLAEFSEALMSQHISVSPLPGNLPGVVVSGSAAVAEIRAYQQGHGTVQNASSMIITNILDPQPGEHILDMCAGSGTKTTHIAELMKNTGHITAADVYDVKLRQLQENCARLGVSIVRTYHGDMTTSVDLPSIDFHGKSGCDRILLDVPCSGCGVLRKYPEAKWTKQETDIAELQQLQARLLQRAASLLAPDGGVLVYSACTTEPEETTMLLQEFLRHTPHFRIESPVPFLPDMLQKYITPEGFLCIEPPQEHFDGFFCARLACLA